MKKVLVLLVFLAALAAPGMAEVSGNLSTANPDNVTVEIVTGLLGYTVDFCNSNSTCFGYRCYLDYDGISSGSSAGWCNATGLSTCVSNGTTFSNGAVGTTCSNQTHQWKCSSGTWTTSECSNGCASDGTCKSSSSSSTSSSGGGGGSSGDTTTESSTIEITSSPPDFELVQGETASKDVIVNNAGDTTLTNVVLEVTGFSNWHSVSPAKVSTLLKTSTTFTITFSPPANATVKTYGVTIKAKSDEASDSASVNVKVVPSQTTVEQEILPAFESLNQSFQQLKKQTDDRRSTGADTSDIEALLELMEAKIHEASDAIESGDYFSASLAVEEAKALEDSVKSKLSQEAVIPVFNPTTIIIVVVVAAVAAFLAYLLWPAREKTEVKGWIGAEKKTGIFGKIKNIFKRKKEKKYEFHSE